MRRKILAYLLIGIFGILSSGFVGGKVYADTGSNCGNECNGIKLNTCFPIIGDCIATSSNDGSETTATTVFPVMMNALAKIIVTIVLVVCFILVIVAGIMWASNNPGSWKGGGAKGLLKKVAITILLLGLTGVILKAINPVFFS